MEMSVTKPNIIWAKIHRHRTEPLRKHFYMRGVTFVLPLSISRRRSELTLLEHHLFLIQACFDWQWVTSLVCMFLSSANCFYWPSRDHSLDVAEVFWSISLVLWEPFTQHVRCAQKCWRGAFFRLCFGSCLCIQIQSSFVLLGDKTGNRQTCTRWSRHFNISGRQCAMTIRENSSSVSQDVSASCYKLVITRRLRLLHERERKSLPR